MTEAEIQREVFNHLRARGKPGLVAWHVNNDKGARRKSGYLAGVHDVHILHDTKFYTMELKVEKGGDVTKEQLAFRDNIHEAGGQAFIARGLPEALLWLEAWGLIRKEAA
jgi:hypothetical protein